MSEAGPRSEVEMSSHFSVLRDQDSGSLFIKEVPVFNPTGITAVGLAPGAIIGGAYKIIELLGYGAMGEVYLAKHLTLEKKCALKVIPPDQVTEIGWQRFQLEAKSVASLNHVNLVRVWDLGIHEQCLPFYAMEYLAGQNLAEILAEQGPIPIEKVLDIFIQVCDGVACAHSKGVIHRDLKPANIMLVQNSSDRTEIKILDFGLAKLMKHDRSKQSLTAVGDVFGSPAYMSPEQCGGQEIDHRSDIYSIGCTLFECLAGRPPFHSHVPGAVFFGHLEATPPSLKQAAGVDKFPYQLETIISKLLRKEQDDRYQSMTDLKTDLESLRDQLIAESGETDSKSSEAFGAKRKKKFRASQYGAVIAGKKTINKPLIVTGAVALIGVAAGGMYFWKQHSLQQEQQQEKQEQQQQQHQQQHQQQSSVPLQSTNSTGQNGQVTTSHHHHRRADQKERNSQADNNDNSEETSTSEIAAGEDKWDGTPFYKGLVTEHGQKLQHWCYNSEHVPLITLGLESPRGPMRVPLSHDQYFPAEAKISLHFRSDPVYPNNRIKALADGNFDEVNFGRYTLKEIEPLVATLAKCQSIKSIRLGGPDWSAEETAASVDVINQFPNLERLSIGAELAGASLAKVKRLGQLTELRLPRDPYLQDCLKLLGNAKRLTSLSVFNWSIPTNALALLHQCPSLETLVIGKLTGSHEQFAMLAALPHLNELQLTALRPRADLTADIKMLKSLHTLKIPYTTDWTNSAVSEMRQQLPGVQIIVYTSPNAHRRRSGGQNNGRQSNQDGQGGQAGHEDQRDQRNQKDQRGQRGQAAGSQGNDNSSGEQNAVPAEDRQGSASNRAD